MTLPYLISKAGEFASPYVSQAIGYASQGIQYGVEQVSRGNAVPVPEVPAFAAPLALFAVLAASVWLLRKKNYNIPVLMK
jgi:hypothetical protein